MGIGSLKSNFKRVAKQVKRSSSDVAKVVQKTAKAGGELGQNYIDVARTPYKVAESVIRGHSSTSHVKEIGHGFSAGARTNSSWFLASSTTGQKALKSDSLNKWTLGTSKEVQKVGKGFNLLDRKKTVHSQFYQSGLSLGAKAVAIGATSAYLAGQSAAPGAIEVTSQTSAGLSGGTSAATVTSSEIGASSSFLGGVTAKEALVGAVVAKKVLGGDIAGAASMFGVPTELFGGHESSDGSISTGDGGGQSYLMGDTLPLSPMVLAGGALVLVLGIYLIKRKGK